MSTTTTLPEPRSIEVDGRTIKAEWLVRQEDGDDGHTEVLVTLTASHYGRPEYVGQLGYCYTASLGRERIIRRPQGYSIRKVSIGVARDSVDSRHVRILRENDVKRYSAAKQRAFFDLALERLRLHFGEAQIADLFDPEQ